ncbi:MAG: hypothetical protein IJI46_10415 [Erysipelotrichaceae bacterium]|nr:hypothetical protein [Erysipelotrichaceae bacterium]
MDVQGTSSRVAPQENIDPVPAKGTGFLYPGGKSDEIKQAMASFFDRLNYLIE